MNKKTGIITGITIIIAALTTWILTSYRQVSPLSNLNLAYSNIIAAKKATGKEINSSQLTEAIMLYDSAMNIWKNENKKFFLLRNYTSVANMADISRQKAIEATKHGVTNKITQKEKLRKQIDSINLLLTKSAPLIKRLPLTKKQKEKYTRSQLLFTEAELALKRNETVHCSKLLNQCSEQLNHVQQAAINKITSYFKNYKKWHKQLEKQLHNTNAGNKYSLIIDKMEAIVYLHKNNKCIMQFHCEMGPNWMTAKTCRGDKATPEGQYYIIKKKQGKQTRYYKAMLIDYPNETDRINNLKTQRKRNRGLSLPPGGNIEIHGHGGRGSNWTEGCIALSDNDMDELFRLIPVSTPVTIIGDINPVEFYLNQLKY